MIIFNLSTTYSWRTWFVTRWAHRIKTASSKYSNFKIRKKVCKPHITQAYPWNTLLSPGKTVCDKHKRLIHMASQRIEKN